MPRWTKAAVERLLDKVEKTASCWNWTGCLTKGEKNKTGYGTIWYNGKQRNAHRVAYEILVGPIPEGLNVLHTCDNSPCVNPAHLYLGTLKDNAQDTLRRGRCRAYGLMVNAKKTHCPQGHEYSEENTYRYNRKRMCRTCRGQSRQGLK